MRPSFELPSWLASLPEEPPTPVRAASDPRPLKRLVKNQNPRKNTAGSSTVCKKIKTGTSVSTLA